MFLTIINDSSDDNAKTTPLTKDKSFCGDSSRAGTNLGVFNLYDKLKDFPYRKTGSATKTLGLKVGNEINILKL